MSNTQSFTVLHCNRQQHYDSFSLKTTLVGVTKAINKCHIAFLVQELISYRYSSRFSSCCSCWGDLFI